jgi:hypothetical protein
MTSFTHHPLSYLSWMAVAVLGAAFLALAYWLRFDAPIWGAF